MARGHASVVLGLALIAGSMHMASGLEIPTLTTAFRKIADTQPDISPYEYTAPNNSACDFTIFQADDGTWQLIACIRGNTYPGSNRFLYRWEGTRLDRGEFTPKGIFWTSGAKDTPDALGRTLGVNTPYTAEGRLQAPHCVKYGGKYYLFHNNSGAYCLISDDGKNWTQHVDISGEEYFFGMGRDVMVFDNTDVDGKYYAYYTDPSTSPQSVAAKTATALDGPWSSSTIRNVYDGHSYLPPSSYGNEFAESPFMLRRGDDYYLFIQRYVFHSRNPTEFDSAPITCLDDGAEWAPEVFQDQSGQFYVGYYKYWGIYIAKFKWVPEGGTPVQEREAAEAAKSRVSSAAMQTGLRSSLPVRAADLLGRTISGGGRAFGGAPGLYLNPATGTD